MPTFGALHHDDTMQIKGLFLVHLGSVNMVNDGNREILYKPFLDSRITLWVGLKLPP